MSSTQEPSTSLLREIKNHQAYASTNVRKNLDTTVGDLSARLIFERLGASLIPGLDMSKPDWEREVTWRAIRNGFADRTGNSNVAALSDFEYQEVQEILNGFISIENGKRLRTYRHKFVHRMTPSVDSPGFYIHNWGVSMLFRDSAPRLSPIPLVRSHRSIHHGV